MRKQTKLVAVLSAAALLAMGASMTSFAAGWQKDDAGVWHYYDSDDNQVTDEWKKDGGKWFYLNEDGDMETDAWVDDDYYVGEDGAMLVNKWIKVADDDDSSDPDDDGENWYYFNNKGKKVTDDKKKINGKTYYFNTEGEMRYGWVEDNGDCYYLGTEDEGWRTDAKWLWLEEPNEDDEDNDSMPSHDDCSLCDSEGWYYFQNDGKAYRDNSKKKKINGKYYYFNEHGQMLYEWIDNKKVSVASNSKLDAARTDGTVATAGEMLYYNEVEDGSRGNGWVQRDGSEAMKTDNDTDWYYIDDGDMYHANTTDAAGTTDDGDPVYVMRKKVKVSGNKYFAFNEKGQMQDGLQFIAKDKGFFYFDENGYQKTGKVASVECEDDDYTFYFTTKNGKNGIGYTGEKDGTLYFNGKRLEADDDYKLYVVDEKVYLVNTKGKIQKASTAKKYDDIVNAAYVGKEIYVKTNKKGVVESVDGVGYTTLVNTVKADIAKSGFVGAQDYDNQVAVPFIALYDGVYTYDKNLAEGWNK